MRIILGTMLKRATQAALPILLSACLFSIEPLLDEANSLSGEEAADVKAFVTASRLAYSGLPGQVSLPMIPFFEKEASTGDLSVIRVGELKGGMLLIQQKLHDCVSDHCFVYYGAQMVATWWPDICLAETEGDEAQEALQALAASHGVIITLISDNDKAPPDFGMSGPRGSELEFLRAQFSEGRLDCRVDEGITELHGAAAMGTPADIAELIEAGADVNVSTNGQGKPGITPLHLAAFYGKPTNIAALIGAGAEIGTLDTNGVTPLYWAASRGSPEAIVVLIEAGAEVNAGDGEGKTPLHYAAQDGTPGTIAALIEAGADVDFPDHSGTTPLHDAAALGPPANVEVLLDAGADASRVDDGGRTPFDLAGENKRHPFKETEAYTRLESARRK